MAKYITDEIIDQTSVGIDGILRDYQADIEQGYLNEESSFTLSLSVKYTDMGGGAIRIDTGLNLVKERVKVKTTAVIDPKQLMFGARQQKLFDVKKTKEGVT